MDTSVLIASIDSEMNRLKQARSLHAGIANRNEVEGAPRQSRLGGKRTLSTEARARINAAQQKRAAQG